MPDGGEGGKFWDARADQYAAKPIKNLEAYQATLDQVRKHLTPTDSVLEVGCGTGTTALNLAQDAGHILATDAAPRMIEIAREKAAAAGVSNVRFERATVFDSACETEPFDVVMAFNVLHLLEDLPAVVRRIHALLAPGGRFVSKTVCLAEHSRFWRFPLAVMRWLGRAPYVDCLTNSTLEATIAAGGFEIVEAASYPTFPPTRLVVAKKV